MSARGAREHGVRARLRGPARSRRATRTTLALAAGIALAAPWGLAAGSRADGSVRAPAAEASALARTAVRDATARGSVHISEAVRAGTNTASISADLGASKGQQVVHLSRASGEAREELVGGTAYFTGSEPMLVAYFGLPATEATTIHGRWISVPHANSAYAGFANALSIASTLRGLIPQASLKLIGTSSLGGVAVTGLRGTIKSVAGSATATVYVSRSATPLPVRVDFRDSQGNTVTATFSDWGEHIAIKAPTSTISITTVDAPEADAAAKELAHAAQVAAETYATDHSGSYAGLTPAVVHSYEASIQITPGHGNAYISAATGSATGYTVTATSTTGDRFSISRKGGAITRTCTPPSVGGCSHGTW